MIWLKNAKIKKNIIADELKLAKRSALGNLTMENITSPEWHEANPSFVHYWLGFKNLDEFKFLRRNR